MRFSRRWLWRMPSSGMWRRVDLVWTDVSEERITSIFRVEKSACSCSHLLTLVPRTRIFLPWRWRRYVPPKRRFTHDLHGATSQKKPFFLMKTKLRRLLGTTVRNHKTLSQDSWCLGRNSNHALFEHMHSSWEADILSICQNIHCLLLNPKFHYRVQKTPATELYRVPAKSSP
jgi:hypothetical protein